ncbi:MAG: hypothetical protein IKG15_07455 [Solobacterium sp.]|nr:hypothetical protein [Solobacterium sp.]
MINVEELLNEHHEIALNIVDTINGNKRDIPYFKYLGSFKERHNLMKARRGIYVFTLLEDVELSPEIIRRYNSATNWDKSLVGAGLLISM